MPAERKRERTEIVDAAFEAYNRAATDFGCLPCKGKTSHRADQLWLRIQDVGGLEQFERAVRAIERDDFLMGRVAKPGKTPFRLTFDRLLSTGSEMGDVLARLLDQADAPKTVAKSGLASNWWKGKEATAPKYEPEFWRGLIGKHANGTWPVEYLGPGPWASDCLVPPKVIAELDLEAKYPTPIGPSR